MNANIHSDVTIGKMYMATGDSDCISGKVYMATGDSDCISANIRTCRSVYIAITDEAVQPLHLVMCKALANSIQ